MFHFKGIKCKKASCLSKGRAGSRTLFHLLFLGALLGFWKGWSVSQPSKLKDSASPYSTLLVIPGVHQVPNPLEERSPSVSGPYHWTLRNYQLHCTHQSVGSAEDSHFNILHSDELILGFTVSLLIKNRDSSDTKQAKQKMITINNTSIIHCLVSKIC